MARHVGDRRLPSLLADLKTISSSFYPGGPGVSFKCFAFFFSSWGMGVLEVAFDSFRLARG